MKIGIDARFLTHPQRGGFKTYTENLIASLSEIDHENNYILYVDREPNETTKLPTQPNFTYKVIPGTRKNLGMLYREQFVLPIECRKDKIDVLHSPCLTAPLALKQPSVVTIHDMIWYYPNRYSPSKVLFSERSLINWYYKVFAYFSAKKAKYIITISNASKQAIVSHLKLINEKIFITLEAPSSNYRYIDNKSLIKSALKKYDLPEKFIFGLGSADPRKNIEFLINAFVLIPDNDLHLVIVWNHYSLTTQLKVLIQNLNLQRQVHFLSEISDQDLLYLYNAAEVFVFPSLEEGFGLPPLEAMACGTPVIAANNSSIPEIVGDAALLFNARNPSELKDLILRVTENESLRKELRLKGLQKVKHYSWDKCASQTLDILYKAAS